MKFKIRASKCSDIMGKRGLGKTGESYIEQWLLEQLYGRKKKMTSKYTEKGLIKEDDAIDMVAEYLDLGMLFKNEKHFEDEYITGTPDIILPDMVIDVKCSWDCFTFPKFKTEVPANYYWQAQCYMHLTGKRKYKLIYCLLDTPEYLIEREHKFNNFYGIDYEEFREDYIYEHLPIEDRIKVFNIEFEGVEKVIERVKECREIIKNLTKNK